MDRSESLMKQAEDERVKVLSLLERYGRNLHSFMILEPGLSLWFTDDAAVAYASRGGYWVAVGAPLCAPERSEAVAKEFGEAAHLAGCRVVFFGVTSAFVSRLQSRMFDSLKIGEAPSWVPSQWNQALGAAGKLRNRLSKARRDGITCRLVSAEDVENDPTLRSRFVAIADEWAESKALPPMGFMVTVELFQHAERRRYFVAEHQGNLCGFAVCIPVYGRNGWLLEDMILRPDAPGGCSECLIDGVMRRLSEEGAEFVSLGLVALAGLKGSESETRHPLLSRFLRVSSRAMGWLYNFEGLYRFRKKLQPAFWEPVYIVSRDRITFFTIRAILMAFAQGWVPRFGVRVLGHWARKSIPLKATRVAESRPLVDLSTLLIAITAITLMVFAILGNYWDIISSPVAIVFGTIAAYIGFTPVHEAVHGNVSRFRLVNQIVGHLCTIPLLGAFLPYCFLHQEHHRHTNDDDQDPDIWCGQGARWLLPLRWATQDIGYLQHYFRNWPKRPWIERVNLLGCGFGFIVIALISFLVLPDLFFALLFGWFIPARLALFILAATFSWLPHAPHEHQSIYQATSVHSSPWLTWLLLGQNFHLVHHLEPRIPFYRLSSRWKNQRVHILSQGGVDHSNR